MKNKPKNYWRSWKNVRYELRTVESELGHFPSADYLHDHASSLETAMRKYHGGYAHCKKRLGHKTRNLRNFRPQHYWTDFDNVATELRTVERELGHFPSLKDLAKAGRDDIRWAIFNHHENYQAVKRRLKVVDTPRKGRAYWQNWDNVTREFNEAIEKMGHFPTQDELKRNGFGGLATAINKYHEGLPVARERMGYGVQPIKTNEQFLNFLHQNPSAQQLSAAAILLNGDAHEVEKIIVDVYDGRFKDPQQLHDLIQSCRDDVRALADEGITNLGAYLGDFSLGDRSIIPVLLGEAISQIPAERVTASISDKFTRILRGVYSPKFNQNPQEVLSELEVKAATATGNARTIYDKLRQHYKESLDLQEELR